MQMYDMIFNWKLIAWMYLKRLKINLSQQTFFPTKDVGDFWRLYEHLCRPVNAAARVKDCSWTSS